MFFSYLTNTYKFNVERKQKQVLSWNFIQDSTVCLRKYIDKTDRWGQMGTYTFWLTFLLEGQMGILTIFFIYCTSKIKKCANRSQRIKNANSSSRQTKFIQHEIYLHTIINGICIFIKFKNDCMQE